MCPEVGNEQQKKTSPVQEIATAKEETEASTGVWELLRIRDKQGCLVPILPNRAQLEYNRCAGKRNIVLKARQLGITTWIAARFFLETITKPGTLTVQVAHDQRAAEAIFRNSRLT